MLTKMTSFYNEYFVKRQLPYICDIGYPTDILVHVNSTCITHYPIFLISHQIHGTPNTPFFMFFSKLGEKKRVIGVGQSVPIKLCVIGVIGTSKSCLGTLKHVLPSDVI